MICKVKVISTGSKGNAVLLNDEILIDCGVPFRELEPYCKGLRLVLLTATTSTPRPSSACTSCALRCAGASLRGSWNRWDASAWTAA